MIARQGQWTRRDFSQALAASAASFITRGAAALTPNLRQGFAFLGVSTDDPLNGSIKMYRVNGSKWHFLHEVTTASPARLLLHPGLQMLYVVHDVSAWDNLPRGAVSAYAFDAAKGRLSYRTTQPLSLSATNPRHGTITAEGNALLVSAQTGGIYNLLSIDDNGDLGPVTAIRKEFGIQDENAAKVAAPGHMVLGATGSIFATDSGQETISRFDMQKGSLTMRNRTRVPVGAGPSSFCISPCERRGYVMRAMDGTLSVHNVSEAGISCALEVHRLEGGGAALLMHPKGRHLIAADAASLRVLRVDSRTGGLTPRSRSSQPRLNLLHFACNGSQLVGVASASGQVISRTFDAATGAVGQPLVLAHACGATSLLISA